MRGKEAILNKAVLIRGNRLWWSNASQSNHI